MLQPSHWYFNMTCKGIFIWELIYFYYLVFHRRAIQYLCFSFPVVLSSLMQYSQQVLFGVEVSSVSWFRELTEFKSLISLIVGSRNLFGCLVWAFDLWVQITDDGISLYIGSFCPAMTSLSKYIIYVNITCITVFMVWWIFTRGVDCILLCNIEEIWQTLAVFIYLSG